MRECMCKCKCSCEKMARAADDVLGSIVRLISCTDQATYIHTDKAKQRMGKPPYYLRKPCGWSGYRLSLFAGPVALAVHSSSRRLLRFSLVCYRSSMCMLLQDSVVLYNSSKREMPIMSKPVSHRALAIKMSLLRPLRGVNLKSLTLYTFLRGTAFVH
jgi:hypothetical protein